ncbi:MAG: TauD/TfdA family dioxygenase [Alphaproteobacteria bacterium]|nr:TauD/TfdA family dioxygenase [Alphaproteobacteria bacterium]
MSALADSPAIPAAPLEGPFCWSGKDLQQSTAWIETLTAPEIAEVQDAMWRVKQLGVPLHRVRRADFALPTLSERLGHIARELEYGRGFVLLRGLPVEQYPDDETRFIVWGIGAHLGVPVSQSKNGELLGEVRDLGVRLGAPTARGYRSNEHLRFHTDLADIVLLLCVRKARAGGLSRVVSSVAIHNEIMRRRPDLLRLLYEDYYHSRQGEEAPGEQPWYAKPVFGFHDGQFSSQYSRSFVESAQRFAEVPRITAAQNEALDLLAEIAEELCLTMALEPGDIQLLNNHVTYHSRTGYEDEETPGRDRLLYRLWLSTPENRSLPPGARVLWGRSEKRVIRGGVPPANGPRYAFPDWQTAWGQPELDRAR